MIRAAAASVAAALAFAVHAGAPVAFVSDVKGSVTIEGAGMLGFLAELAAGTKLARGRPDLTELATLSR